MYRLAVYGKGGIGKSTVSANMSYLLSMAGHSVLHVGCDPKHDSTRLLTGGVLIPTFFSDTSVSPVYEGECGVRCVECGGAEPGKACAGKGIELLFSKIADVDADFRISDVLGDVVCGGFSVPARAANADAVLIVTSGEYMSIYAANNILKGLANINPGACVAGIVLNRRGNEDGTVFAFAEAVGLPIVCDLPRSSLFAEAEKRGGVLCKLFPDSDEALALKALADFVASGPICAVPKPLSEGMMSDLATGRPIRRGETVGPARKCSFDSFDPERNLTYLDDMVMPACTSHGAVDGAMRIRDVAIIMHGPRNCAYLMEFAFRRRALNGVPERPDEPVPNPNLYSTEMDADRAFRDSGESIVGAVRRAARDGHRTALLIPTCSSEIIGMDVYRMAAMASERTGVNVIAVRADDYFLSSKFGGTFGLFDALIGRMAPREPEKGTVNLIARWFYGAGRKEMSDSMERILNLMGLRTKFRFLDFCKMEQIEDFCSAEYDIQLGRTKLNDRVSERITEVTGRRRALVLDTPMGLCESIGWLHRIAEYAPELADRSQAAESALRAEFEDGMANITGSAEGKRVIIFCHMARDLQWQLETLNALGVEVAGMMFARGHVIDHNEIVPDYGDIPVTRDCGMCDLRRVMAEGGIDAVLTNDPDRVGREGFNWIPLGSRKAGVRGAIDWAQTVVDSMLVPGKGWEDGL